MGFKRIVVITSINDNKTSELCDKYKLETIKIDYQRPFIWGIYRNIALRYIDTGWVLGMDCDTYLPFKRKIKIEKLQRDCIYGLKHEMTDHVKLDEIKSGIKQPRCRKWFRKCMGPMQLFNLDYAKEKGIKYLESGTMIEGKGASWHFAKNFKKRRLFDEIIYCLNLGDRTGRKAERIPEPKPIV
jgi:hypothetical protein